tara:strand:+ start:19 stop:630 length:612 start_codon:yes stop_codon:yes gene_type:complete
MSSLKLLHSGGNGVIISAPSSNPAANRTITVPGNADGEILTTTNPKTGNIIQVVSTTKTDTGSSSVDGGALTNHVLTQAITPSATSSKVLVQFHVTVSSASTMNRLAAVITRNGTAVGVSDSTGDNKTENTVCIAANNSSDPYTLCGNFLDSPSSTSAVTYGIKIRTGTSSTITIYFNRQGSESNNIYIMRGTSTLTCMEVAG